MALQPMRTGIIPNPAIDAVNDDLQFARIRGAGATTVSLTFSWTEVAPRQRRPGFDPTDPADPDYDWRALDRRVRLAANHNLDPILTVSGAPTWAQPKIPPTRDGPFEPDPNQFGKFAKAVALRYSGRFRDLPHVRYYVAWNEPNNYRYLTPQKLNGKPFSPQWYRRMLNAFSSSVHAVRADNLVVAGAMLAFGIGNKLSPLLFMREMLCMSKGAKPHATCAQKSTFDIWSTHPYTRGDPFHQASAPDDVSLGDLPEMRSLLDAAVRAHKVQSKHKVQFWVDEISYDSRPPDPSQLTLPVLLHARYVSESLYQMWRSKVKLAVWFLLRDDPVSISPFQSGLWFMGSPNDLGDDWPKPALTAFRFPFVAYRNGKKVSLWGRTPTSTTGSVAVEVGTPYGWRRAGTVHAGGNGVFAGKLSYSRIPKLASAPALSASYDRVVKADKPRSYWHLDDRSGSVARDAMGQANGTYVGRLKRDSAGALKRSADKAVQFTGDGRVALPSMRMPRTVELWLRTSAKGNLPAFSFRGSVPDSLSLGPARGFARATEGNSSLASFNLVNDGGWHHVVYTVGKGKAQLYVDGRLHDATPWTPQSDPVTGNLGYDPKLQSYFSGTIDEVAVYDHSLTAGQVARHYAASGRKVGTVGMLRARVGSSQSWPFSLKRPRDRFILAFG